MLNNSLQKDISQLTDEEIVKKVQEGETQLFGLLVERYQRRLLAYAWRFVSRAEDAQDMVQEIFIKTYKNIKSFDTSRKFSPWIYRIAHNELVSNYKRRLRDLVDFFDFDAFFPYNAEPAAKENINERLDTENLRQSLEKCLKKIDAKYREPLALYFFEEMEYREIAEILRIPISTVGVRINRGKAQLRKICGDLKKNNG